MFKTEGKTIQCQAAVAWEVNKPLSIETIDVAPPKAGEVRIKITSTGVCHTDQSILTGVFVQSQFPMILGHEGCGIVESVGEGVTSVKPGDHVIPSALPQCKTCDFCGKKESNRCQKLTNTQMQGLMSDNTTRFTCKGKTIHHFFGCSTFSEYTVVAEFGVCKINPTAPLDKVCLLGCGISTGYGAAVNNAKVAKDSTCAIWGLGGVGLAVAMGCKVAGASRVIGIDINPTKFEIAKKFGVTEFINPKECQDKTIVQLLEEMTGGLDYTFECIGNVNTMRAALDSAHVGWGVCVLIGVGSMSEELRTNPLQFIDGRTLKGSAFGGWKCRDDIPMLVEEYLQGKIMIDEFISHNLSLESINDAFDLMKDGKSIRTVVHMAKS